MNEIVPTKIYKLIDDEYLKIVDLILKNEEFKKRLLYHHHENRSVYAHSLMVSLYSYKIAKKMHLDYKSIAIGALLHDFYYKDWQLDKIKKPFFKLHGFVHANEALENSKKNFDLLLNKKIENIIKRHMFPLNIVPPFYFESWVVCFVDKYCSLEIFKHPNQLYKYIGIKSLSYKKNYNEVNKNNID